jgi:hypothetical protein
MGWDFRLPLFKEIAHTNECRQMSILFPFFQGDEHAFPLAENRQMD